MNKKYLENLRNFSDLISDLRIIKEKINTN